MNHHRERYFLFSILLLMLCMFIRMPIAQTIIDTHIYATSETSSMGPKIQWNWKQGDWMAIDGIYRGQTEERFEFGTYIQDPDGVSTVLLRVKWPDSGDWINCSTVRTDGKEETTYYSGNITWTPVMDLITFHIKIFANDTLGNWSETTPLGVEFVYVAIITSTTSTTTSERNYPWLLVLSFLGVLILAIILIWKHKH